MSLPPGPDPYDRAPGPAYEPGRPWPSAPRRQREERHPRHASWAEPVLVPAGTPPEPTGGTGQQQWPLVADELFLVAHDDRGKPMLTRRTAKSTLAAALIGELVLTGFVTLRDRVLLPVVEAAAQEPLEPLAGAANRQIRAEQRGLTVRDWMTYLATIELGGADLYDHVGRRLVRGRRVDVQEYGLPLRRKVRYAPVDVNVAGWPGARISSALKRGWDLGPGDIVVGGLMLATELHRQVLTGDIDELERRLRACLDRAPRTIRELLRAAEEATASAINTGTK